MKRSGDVRNSAQAALAAAERTFQRSGPLPFETTPAGDPLQAGRRRLKGAFLIEVTRICADPKQPRRGFDDTKLKELTASVSERGLKQPLRVWFVANDNRRSIEFADVQKFLPQLEPPRLIHVEHGHGHPTRRPQADNLRAHVVKMLPPRLLPRIEKFDRLSSLDVNSAEI